MPILNYAVRREPGLHVFTSRGACLAGCVLAFGLTILFTCRANTPTMMAVLLTDGLCAAAWILGAVALGNAILSLFRIRTNRLLLFATAGGLGLGMFGLLGLLFGLAGLLNRPVALAFPIVSVLIWAIPFFRRAGVAGQPVNLALVKRWLAVPAGFSWVWLIPVISLAMVCVSASLLPGALWKPFDPAPYDVTSYHLQVPREWFESGRITPLAHNMFSYFPFNVEMQFLLLMHVMGGPWAGMYACQFVCVGYAVMMVIAVAGAASEAGVGTAVIGAAFAAVVPWTLMLAGVAYVESGLLLYTALAIAWTLQAVRDVDVTTTSFHRAMLIAGLMTGFAASVKITAVPMLMVVLPVAVCVVRFRSSRKGSGSNDGRASHLRGLCLGCIGFGITGAVAVSPWLIRNAAWAGNPLWPVAMNTLGRGRFSPDQVDRFRIAHSPRDDQKPLVARIVVLWRDVLIHWQYGYVIIPAGLLAAALRWRDRQTWVLLLTAGVVFVVWIGFTHLLARFLVMLIPIAGIAIGRVRWGRFWSVGVVVACIAAGVAWISFVPELMKLSAVAPDRALFAIVDLSGFLPPEVVEARDNHKQIALVGNAQAFFYQVPMTQLHYRSVFDLPADAKDAVEAWVGNQAKGNSDYVLIVNISEIDRLHRTYHDVPGVPKEWVERGEETFVLSGDVVKK